ncbi:MAG TPA: TetR/AcrR family transcriptional regulator [Actinomycetota bacterium]|nr:TetR/AcrR family transcriptional regulator [Actinomycetota bacterium]
MSTRRLPADERREQILATARRLVAENGYDGLNMDEVAEAVGVTKPVLYRHFTGKRDLYDAVLEEHLADLIRRLWVALSSSPDPRARLRSGLEAYFRFADEREDGFRTLVEASARNEREMQEKLGDAWDTLADGIARTVGDLLRAAELDPAGAPIYARALIGMAQSVAEWWVRTRRIPRADLVDYLLALTWRGFDGLPRHPTQRQPIKRKPEPAKP